MVNPTEAVWVTCIKYTVYCIKYTVYCIDINLLVIFTTASISRSGQPLSVASLTVSLSHVGCSRARPPRTPRATRLETCSTSTSRTAAARTISMPASPMQAGITAAVMVGVGWGAGEGAGAREKVIRMICSSKKRNKEKHEGPGIATDDWLPTQKREQRENHTIHMIVWECMTAARVAL